MLGLHEIGWGTRRIARELGCSRTTVQHYLAAGEWHGYRRRGRRSKLAGETAWLRERLIRHHGNADVVRQDLARERGIVVSLRTLERAVAPFRAELAAQARATLRFETPPGRQLQIDFGQKRVAIGGVTVPVFLFVATLGYSRLLHVQPFRHERQSAWLAGLEAAFRHGACPSEGGGRGGTGSAAGQCAGAGGPPRPGHPRGAVQRAAGSVCPVLGLHPARLCTVSGADQGQEPAPAKAGDESGVKYVKRNALAGHSFDSWAALEAHLERWRREVADLRRHGTTEEAPRIRFERDEAATLRPLNGRPPFQQVRELVRMVGSEGSIELDTNSYSVPWRLIGQRVAVIASGGRVAIQHDGTEVAAHAEVAGRRQRVIEPSHYHGMPGLTRPAQMAEPAAAMPAPALLRPLAEYEQAVGGGW